MGKYDIAVCKFLSDDDRFAAVSGGDTAAEEPEETG